jgi:DNA polymerase III epsilon subunit-like protein
MQAAEVEEKERPQVTRHLIFDTETTDLLKPSTADLKGQPKIIEIGLIEVHAADGVATIFDEKSWLIYPGEQIGAETTKITGLTNQDLEGKPCFIDVLPDLERAFLGVEGLVCHNLPFDLGMLVTELKRCGREHQFPYPPRQLCTVSAYQFLKGHNLRPTSTSWGRS